MLEVMAPVILLMAQPVYRATVAPIPVCRLRVLHISNGHEQNIILLLIVTAGGGAGGCSSGVACSVTNCCQGAMGGSGVVIISYPVSFQRATTTGKKKRITNSRHT